jgi:sterol desaturase/sphingolipid hydroxylase (fatty acid hydroxylase superfamily)
MNVSPAASECLSEFALRMFPLILQADFTRYAIGAGLTFVAVEFLLRPWTKSRQIRDNRPGLSQIFREILASLRTVAIFAGNGLLIAIGVQTGFLTLAPEPLGWGWLWFAANLAILLLAHDAWFYWTHRLMHRPRLFRWFHRLHHRSHNPTPFAAYAFNASEAVVNATFYPVVLALVPTSISCALVFLFIMMTLNAIGHSGHELYPARRDGTPLFDFFTTVTHHDLHHAHARWNFGLYFTHWDRWMGTEHPHYHDEFRRAVSQCRIVARASAKVGDKSHA